MTSKNFQKNMVDQNQEIIFEVIKVSGNWVFPAAKSIVEATRGKNMYLRLTDDGKSDIFRLDSLKDGENAGETVFGFVGNGGMDLVELTATTDGAGVTTGSWDYEPGEGPAGEAIGNLGQPLQWKGPATVAELNAGITGIQPGWTYTLTDAGTLTDGSVTVDVDDEVAWTEDDEWFKVGVNKKTPTFEVDIADFAVSDGNGKRCLVVYDGHLITKNFDSRKLQEFYKVSKNYGKSVGVFGGSLSVYPESQAVKKLWKKYLSLDITDYGVGGAGFSSLQGTTPIQTQVDNAASKDIYILWASTNDYTNSREIGSYSDYTYLDNYDSSKLTTQCGGINYCIKKLYEKNPLAEIYFFTGIDFFSQEGGYNPFTEQANLLGYTYQQYVDAQKKCCELFSIPVLDQNAISGLNIFNYTNFFKSDNLHMKEAGYEKIAMQQIQFLANGL
jgi:hypothetical protein